jgi:hypothetical protein
LLKDGVLVQRSLEQTLDRRDDDQEVEAVAARQRRDPAHLPNVHRVVGRRLLLSMELPTRSEQAGSGWDPVKIRRPALALSSRSREP